MQHYTVQLPNFTPENHQKLRAIVLMSHHNRNKKKYNKKDNKIENRSQSVVNTKSYNDALQRAFNHAKTKIYFNPDMKYFLTFTYSGKDHTPADVLQHIKIFIKNQKRKNPAVDPKYIYVMEYQKRGSIHVHMIANKFFNTHKNKNGYKSLTDWKHGFTSVLEIKDFDSNFKPYLYLFKYMKKAQRIGKSFLHSSRNLNNFYTVQGKSLDLSQFTEKSRQYSQVSIGKKKLHFYRYYLEQYSDIVYDHLVSNK